MKTSHVKTVILEFADSIEGQKWTRDRVNDLKKWISDMPLEEARIAAFCEVHNYTEPPAGAFPTLEKFREWIEEEKGDA